MIKLKRLKGFALNSLEGKRKIDVGDSGMDSRGINYLALEC